MSDTLLQLLLRTAARRALSGDASESLVVSDSRRDESSVGALLTRAGPRFSAAMAMLEPHCAARMDNLVERWPYVRARRGSLRLAASIMDSILAEVVESVGASSEMLPGNSVLEAAPTVAKAAAATHTGIASDMPLQGSHSDDYMHDADASPGLRPAATTAPKGAVTSFGDGEFVQSSKKSPMGAMPAADDSGIARRRARRKKNVDRFLHSADLPDVLSPLPEHACERTEGVAVHKEGASLHTTRSLSPCASRSSSLHDAARPAVSFAAPQTQVKAPSPPSVSLLSMVMQNRPAADSRAHPETPNPQCAQSDARHAMLKLPSGSPSYLTGATPPARPCAPVQNAAVVSALGVSSTAGHVSALGVSSAADALSQLCIDTPVSKGAFAGSSEGAFASIAGAIDSHQDPAGPAESLAPYVPGAALSTFTGHAPSEHHRSFAGTAAARTAAASDAPKSGRMSAGASSTRSGRRRPRQSDTSSDLPSSMYIW